VLENANRDLRQVLKLVSRRTTPRVSRRFRTRQFSLVRQDRFGPNGVFSKDNRPAAAVATDALLFSTDTMAAN
jgi:hypothetical protein